MFEYLVIDHRNNTTTKKVAKSHRYYCWMYWNVYSKDAVSSSASYDIQRGCYVVNLWK